MTDRWTVIDFETATGSRASACAVAAVTVESGEVVDERRWLIQPPGNEYDSWNIRIHGITPDQTASAPSFSEVWSEVESVAAGSTLVAHNAGFDLSVVRYASDHYGVVPLDAPYACTLVLGRRSWKGLASYSLPWVCEHLGFDLVGHHDPLADARACAQIGLRILAAAGTTSWEVAAETLDVRLGLLGSADRRCLSVASEVARMPDANPEADPEHPLYGSVVAFTGALSQWSRAEAAALAAERGATCVANVSGKTNFVVTGEQDARRLRTDGLSSKLRKAAELAAKGKQIEILTEDDFARML